MIMTWSDDPGRDADRYFAAKEEELEQLPKCESCGEPIQDEYYWDFGGTIYCEKCAAEEYRKSNPAI